MNNLYFGLSMTLRDKLLLLVLVFLLNGCALVTKKDNSEEMYIKASALTKLTTAIEGTVHWDKAPSTLSDQEIMNLSTEDDPSLLEPFDGYLLRMNRKHQHVILLVCNLEGTKGLLEDAGCTAEMDKHLWQGNEVCGFSLRSDLLCRN